MRMKYLIAVIAALGLCYLPLAQALSLNGFTRFGSEIAINARVNGIVKSIRVKPGQLVNKGDTLIVLDALPYERRLDKARAIEKSLKPRVETKQLELDRAFELYDRDSLSQVELKNAQNELAQAEGEYQAAQADTLIADYELFHSVIRSPVSGRVLQVHSNIDQYVNPEVSLAPLITIATTRQMTAVGLINSEQWDSSLLNHPATIRYRNKVFDGKVSYIGFKRVQQATGLPAYEIHVSFETDQLIPEKMPVTVEIRD